MANAHLILPEKQPRVSRHICKQPQKNRMLSRSHRRSNGYSERCHRSMIPLLWLGCSVPSRLFIVLEFMPALSRACLLCAIYQGVSQWPRVITFKCDETEDRHSSAFLLGHGQP